MNCAHAAVLFKVSGDELLRLRWLDAEILRKPESRKPINDAEVHHLRLPTMIGRDHQRRHAEHLRSCQRVNIVPAPVSFDQQRIMRKVRQQPQFDLRIISRQAARGPAPQ